MAGRADPARSGGPVLRAAGTAPPVVGLAPPALCRPPPALCRALLARAPRRFAPGARAPEPRLVRVARPAARWHARSTRQPWAARPGPPCVRTRSPASRRGLGQPRARIGRRSPRASQEAGAAPPCVSSLLRIPPFNRVDRAPPWSASPSSWRRPPGCGTGPGTSFMAGSAVSSRTAARSLASTSLPSTSVTSDSWLRRVRRVDRRHGLGGGRDRRLRRALHATPAASGVLGGAGSTAGLVAALLRTAGGSAHGQSRSRPARAAFDVLLRTAMPTASAAPRIANRIREIGASPWRWGTSPCQAPRSRWGTGPGTASRWPGPTPRRS